MFDLWYEDELAPPDSMLAELASAGVVAPTPTVPGTIDPAALKAVVRVDRPRWRRIPDGSMEAVKSPDVDHFLLVRLGFQFVVTDVGERSGTRIRTARCIARLFPEVPTQPNPRVYDQAPRDLYEGAAQRVELKFAPKISLGFVEAAAEIGHGMDIGTVEPAVVGYPGPEEREPYWDLTPNSGALLGVRHFWLVVEVLNGCTGVWLDTATAASISTPWLPAVPLRSTVTRAQDRRPAILLKT